MNGTFESSSTKSDIKVALDNEVVLVMCVMVVQKHDQGSRLLIKELI